MREGVHEPAEGHGDHNEQREIAEGAEETRFRRRPGKPRERDGNQRRAENHCRKVTQTQFFRLLQGRGGEASASPGRVQGPAPTSRFRFMRDSPDVQHA